MACNLEMNKIILSALPKLWIIDLDGTIVRHNGHLTEQGDVLLDDSVEFIKNVPRDDFVLITTARSESCRDDVERMLRINNVRYDMILFGMPVGERILINDIKPSGLKTAYSVNLERDEGINVDVVIDPRL